MVRRNTPQYNKIAELCRNLNPGDKRISVTQMRSAGKELLQLLSEEPVRRRLAQEATPESLEPGESVKAIQRRAVAQIWRLVISNAIASAEKILDSKYKLTNEDVRLPAKLFQVSSYVDDLFDENAPALSKKEHNMLLEYCISMLNDDKVMGVDGAEKILLDMLAQICSKREIVANFRPEKHVQVILEEIEKRLIQGDDDEQLSGDTQITEVTAKLLKNLLSTLFDLGFSLHMILPSTIKMIATWCHQKKNRDDDVPEYPYMISAAAVLLRSCPDLAVASMERYGRKIFTFVRRRVNRQMGETALDPSLIEYLLRHLIVCQVAGKLQGLMPGDLGNVGSATLGFKYVSFLLEKLLSTQSKEHGVSETVSEYGKAHLELTVRLLACAQRMYIARAEWMAMDDPLTELSAPFTDHPITDDYNRLPFDDNDDGMKSVLLAPSALSESPFVNMVLRHLLPGAPGSSVATSFAEDLGTQSQRSPCFGDIHSSPELELSNNPLLESMVLACEGSSASKPLVIIAMLQVVSAACEMFPLGSCWASSTSAWHKISENEMFSEEIYVRSGSFMDLVAVLKTVVTVLEAHGGHNAAADVQRWVLICLNKLAISTDAHLTVLKAQSLDQASVAEVWRHVWRTLLSPSMSFGTSTKACSPGSNGDMVIRVLIQIIRFACVDPVTRDPATVSRDSFLVKQQADIWSLPAFEHCGPPVPSAFMLIYVVLRGCGLSDVGTDKIGRSLLQAGNEVWASRQQEFGSGRRSKLLCFCLYYIERSREIRLNEHLVSIIIACISGLVNGWTDAAPTLVFFGTSSNGIPCAGILPGDTTFTRFCDSRGVSTEREGLKSYDDLFSCLWRRPVNFPENFAAAFCTGAFDDDLDTVGRGLLLVLQHSQEAEEKRGTTVTSIRQTLSERLFLVAESSLRSLAFSRIPNEYKAGDDGTISGVDDILPEVDSVPWTMSSLFLRGFLTVALTSHKDTVIRFSEHICSTVAEFFGNVPAATTAAYADKERQLDLFSDLIRVVRGLEAANAEIGLPLGTLKECRENLYNFCTSLLEGYTVGGIQVTEETATTDVDTLDRSDNESDGANSTAATSGKKRRPKNRTTNGRRKQRRSLAPHGVVLIPRCAYLVGGLLISLNPELNDCIFVARKLFGGDIDTSAHGEYCCDVWGGIFTVVFICHSKIIIGARLLDPISSPEKTADSSDSSPSVLICRVVHAIRDSSMPHSVAHLFGFSCCAKIISIFEEHQELAFLNKNEARQIVELLRTPTNSQDSRSLALRPRIQVARLAATIGAFRGSCPSIHAELDADFGRDFVLPFLGHINSEVRRHGCIAVGVALAVLQEERVIESVRKRLCPIARNESHFEEWISNQSGNTDKSNASDIQIWKDAEAPLRFDVLRCWSTIAASSSNLAVLQQIFFDTVRVLLADPTLLPLCFQMLEQTADSKGYTTIENMLDAEIAEFARRWLTTGLRLVDFPIIISGPSAFRKLLWGGHSAQLSPADGGTCEESPLVGITNLASLSFLRRHTCDFLPAIMIQTVATMIESSAVRDGRRLLLENESLKELCWTFADRFDDDAAKIMLENHFPAVLAAALLLRNGSDDDVAIADGMIRIVKGLLTDERLKNLCNRTSGMIARRVLELIGQPSVNDDDEVFLTTLRSLVELCGKTPVHRGENIFGQIGCTVVELLLFTRYRLHVSSTAIQTNSRWRSCRAVVEVFLEQMRYHRDGNYQADFPFHTFLAILSDQTRTSVRLLALQSLKEIVEEIARVCSNSLQTKYDLNGAMAISLFGSVLDLHRRCQSNLLEVCTGLQRRDENLSKRTWGFVRSAIDDGGSSVVSNLSTILHKYHHRVCQDILDCLTGTYWLLRALVDSRELLNLSSVEIRYLLKEETDSSSLLAIGEFNELYCAQAFINGVVGEAENGDTANISALMNRLASYASTSQQMVAAAPAEIEFSLHQLETALSRHCRGNQLSSFDINKLSQIVLQYCSGEQNSENTKVTASRCLGELGFESSKADYDSVCTVTENESQSLAKHDCDIGPLKVLQAHAIERLARLLQSSDPARAMVTVDTLTALLSVRVGRDCFLLIKEEGISTLLQPFLDSTRVSQPRLSNLELEKDEIERVRARGGGEIEGDEYQLWCWDNFRWQVGPGTFFDAWICQLVPALIVCNYGEGGQSLNNKFFRKCQRLSCIDFSFAVTLFPAIILDLLLTSADRCMSKTVQKDRVLLDTWIGSNDNEINSRLSSAFRVLLTSCANSADSRFVEVATDVLDMLRRVTQGRFMSSSNHKRNKSRPLTDDAIPWRGVPYGTVLKLDGAIVTNAFIQAHRFEGALFYAELYADGRFRGSTAAAKVLALEPSGRMECLRATTVRDVSGFSVQVPSQSSDRITSSDFPLGDALENDSYSFLMTLKACFANLEEDDCRRAVDRQISEFAFYGFRGPLADTAVFHTTEPSMRQLQKLDRMSFIDRRSHALKLSTANCLQGLGCLDTLGLYISGLWSSEMNPVTFEESAEIREKWFYCRLFEMQWDDKLFRGNSVRSDAPEQMSPANLDGTVKVVEPPEAHDVSGEESGFYERLVEALVTLRADDYNECLSHLRSARQCFINLLSSRPTMTTTVEKIAEISSPLRVLNDMEDLAASADFRAVRNFLSRCRSPASFLAGYSLDSVSNCVREVTLQSLRSKSNMTTLRKEITETLVDHLTREFEFCLNAGKVQTAEGTLQRWYAILKSFDNEESNLSNISLLSLRLREATLFERSGDFLGAIRVAQLCARSLQDADVVNDLDKSSLCADALTLCGKWTANHKVEPANVVLTSYLEPAAEISRRICDHFPNDRNKDRFTDGLLSQSELAFSLLKSLSNRVRSTEWKRKEGILVNRKNELEQLEFKKVKETETLNKKGPKKGRDNSLFTSKAAADLQDIHRVYEVLKSEYRIAVTERNDILRSIEGYRHMALRTLVTALSVAGVGSSKDLSKYVCRLVSMWFSIDNPIQLENVDGIIEEAVTKIPSFRFVPLVKQIFSRLEGAPSQTRLHQLVERMSRDHPYHCVAPLITQSGYIQEGTNSKAQAATSILQKLAQDDSAFLGELIDSYRKLFHAYIHLISVSPGLFEKKLEKPIPLNEVSKMASDHLDRCLGTGSRKTPFPPCVLTKPPLLRPGRDYGDKEGISDPIGGERVAGFENYFIISSSGLSKPKIVVCKGTQGGRFKQLLKGDDDTRQDAVMQQLFVYVNGLLARQPNIRSGPSGENKLSLRLATYNVVPLNEQSGVIEWVDHCRAFKDYILDNKGPGGNSRYYPDEPSFPSCKNFFDEAKDAPVEVRLEVFKRILSQKSPVFRYFFVEKFGSSLVDWHASKLRYTRSVAVNSMVGHVFGIGDRHLSNMMVHQETGEVIHIDFGVVFERGKILRTPERVPFRMTQNIVDGMGPLGTEGTFTTAAITTLSTLRENTDSVLTLLSAVVADPFYNWNLATRHVKKSSTNKEVSANDVDVEQATYGEDDFDIIRVEGGNAGSVGEDQAGRAIARIEEKLHGYEDGTSAEQQSVESQVQLLLNAAQDPTNLCQMFGGWLPYV